jgi:hypothetical protein
MSSALLRSTIKEIVGCQNDLTGPEGRRWEVGQVDVWRFSRFCTECGKQNRISASPPTYNFSRAMPAQAALEHRTAKMHRREILNVHVPSMGDIPKV